jgi:hypothetical protein
MSKCGYEWTDVMDDTHECRLDEGHDGEDEFHECTCGCQDLRFDPETP